MKNCAIGIALLALAGCVTSRSPDFPDYNKNLSGENEKKSISYSIIRTQSASPSKNFDPDSSTVAMAGAWVGPETEDAIKTKFSRVFEDAATSLIPFGNDNATKADITLHINQQNAWNPLTVFPAFVSGYTLLIVPCWGDDVYYLKVKATRKTGLKKEYLIMRDVSTTTWLPFIFAMPFGELPATARDKITLENWKELRYRMEADGFFDKSDK